MWFDYQHRHAAEGRGVQLHHTFMAGARLLAKKSSNLKDLTDLRGKTIVVTEKTTTETVIKQLNTERNLGMKIVCWPKTTPRDSPKWNLARRRRWQ